MSDDCLEIKLDNKEIEKRLLQLASKGENLRPLMKNIAGIFAYSTEENFKEEGRPKWQDLKDSTKKQREKIGKWPGQILQVEGRLAASVTTRYDDNSALIGSNKDYAAIHQTGGNAGRNLSTAIPARPYISISDSEQSDILSLTTNYLKL